MARDWDVPQRICHGYLTLFESITPFLTDEMVVPQELMVFSKKLHAVEAQWQNNVKFLSIITFAG